MKGNLMKPPVVADLFHHKLTHQNHLKKLDFIRNERRSQLQQQKRKSVDFQSLKDIRSRSFAHKFNEKNYEIAQSNLKFLVKLQKVKPYTTHNPAPSERPIPSFPSSVLKRKIIETERENSRIFMKMKSVSSNLSRQRMVSDYIKAEKIKSRITRYAIENSKVTLKSEKLFSANKSFSNRSLQASPRNSLVGHYRKEDIIRNKVARTDLKDIKKRALPSLGRQLDSSGEDGQKAFFTTEPMRNKRVFTQRKKLK